MFKAPLLMLAALGFLSAYSVESSWAAPTAGATTSAGAATSAGATSSAGAAAMTPAAGVAPVSADVDAQKILSASDAIRNPNRSFGLTTTLIEYHNGHQTDMNTLQIYAKAEAGSGQYRNLIRFVAPARDLNKLMLKNGNDLWFYDPSSQASVRISPRQRLLGQAANGDVVTVNLAADYHARLVDEEDIDDGDRVARHCYKLKLAAANSTVTYDSIEMWIDTGNSRPVKAKFYAESGELLKTAYYRHFERQLEIERPMETVIIDGLDHQWVTIMRYSNYAWREVPDSWLQRDYLSRFRPE
jgi:outer membrane lipoprotein-sorting protein